MDQVIPNLWIGSISSALNKDQLDEHNIKYVLSAMRGGLRVDPRFVRYQINIDDTETTDILVHLPPAITFIETALHSGKGVLVHCQAGMSRSASIVAAYLMYSKGLTLDKALDLLIAARPIVCPNDSFMRQLELFQKASCKITSEDKATRAYYLERTVAEVMNGDGSILETDMFARYPRMPTDSAPTTSRRRIRCKMCRQELATQEHMLEHNQLVPTSQGSSDVDSAIGEMSTIAHPQVSRQVSTTDGTHAPIRRSSSMHEVKPSPFPGLDVSSTSKTTSVDGRPESTTDVLSSALHDSDGGNEEDRQDSQNTPLRAAALSESIMLRSGPLSQDGLFAAGGLVPETTMTALNAKLAMTSMSNPASGNYINSNPNPDAGNSSLQSDYAQAELSPAAISPSKVVPSSAESISLQNQGNTSRAKPSNSILANLKIPFPVTTPTNSNIGSLGKLSSTSLPSPPIIQNSKCSGYFLEPMKWMEPILEAGQISGKILCPNKKCNAKLGNYDWAGINCSCKEWVTPAFCIHRSKVDEVW